MAESPFARPQGHDGGPAFLDGLAKLYISVAIAWTIVLSCGITYLFIHRRETCVRVRNLPLALSAVACLHVYWVLCMVAYPMNGVYPCQVEYWIMSIYLPVGIGLFQANNMQLLSVACLQEQLLSSSDSSAPKVKPAAQTFRRYWLRYNGLSLLRRTEIAVGFGMIIQLVISLAVFLMSSKFTSLVSGHDPVPTDSCRRGPEWIPSIIWQFTWAWLFAPFILWKIRHIHDIHHWRRQTTVCLIAALPGSPLWLASLYSSSPVWAAINKYWVPPLWFAPGIMAIQAATILAPCVTLRQNLRSRKYVTQAIQDWENRKGFGDKTSLAGSTAASRTLTVSTRTSSRSAMHSKDALEKYLTGDVHALLDFAVHKEFSGENITFLVFVRQWRAAWNAVLDNDPDYDWERDPHGSRRHLFQVAVEIFADLVEVHTSRFAINIEAPVLVSLRRTFAEAARLLDRPLSATNVATPFSQPGASTHELVECCDFKGPIASEAHTWPQQMYLSSHRNIMTKPTRLPDTVVVPHDFAVTVFDRAHDSVMHMVLHNTWPRFIDEYARSSSVVDDAETGLSKRIGLRTRKS